IGTCRSGAEIHAGHIEGAVAVIIGRLISTAYCHDPSDRSGTDIKSQRPATSRQYHVAVRRQGWIVDSEQTGAARAGEAKRGAVDIVFMLDREWLDRRIDRRNELMENGGTNQPARHGGDDPVKVGIPQRRLLASTVREGDGAKNVVRRIGGNERAVGVDR